MLGCMAIRNICSVEMGGQLISSFGWLIVGKWDENFYRFVPSFCNLSQPPYEIE